MTSKARILIPGLLIAVCGILALLYSTRSGYGISPDSAAYLYGAESYSKGIGMRDVHYGPADVYLTHFPPAFSFLIAAVSKISGTTDYAGAATYINIFLWGATLFLFWLILYKHTLSLWWSLVPAFFLLTNLDLVRIYEMVWSEPMYIFFATLGLWLLSRYMTGGRMVQLLAACACVTVAASARYIGIVLIGTVVLALLLRLKLPWRRKIFIIIISGALSSLLLGGWLLRNYLIAKNVSDRKISFHPMTSDYYIDFLSTIKSFFIPGPFGSDKPWIIGLVIFVLIILAIVLLRKKIAEFLRADHFAFLLTLYTVCYLVFIFFSNTFLDFTPLYFRIIDPVLVYMLIAAVMFVHRSRAEINAPRIVKIVMMAGIVILLFMQVKTFKWYLRNKDEPEGYLAGYIRNSEILQGARELSTGKPVFTNAVDVFYANGLPLFYNVLYIKDEQLNDGGIAVIYKHGNFSGKYTYDNFSEVFNDLHPSHELVPVKEMEDGRIYEIVPVQ